MTDTYNVRIDAELTDTFGGEANYCWVRRASFTVPANATDQMVIRRAKRELGVSGRHQKDSYGEGITLRFPHACMVAFLSFNEA